MDLQLKDRVFIVTGGSRGLGFAVARALVDEGSRVLVCARDPGRLDAAIAALGATASGLAADLTAPETPARLIDAARSRFGGLDGAFVSHGGPRPGPGTALDDDTLRQAFELAAIAPIRFLRDVVAALSPGGSVVVLTSSSTAQPIAGLASSNAARPAVWGYAKTLSDEVAPRGVRVNLLLPGRFETERVAQVDAAEAAREGISSAEVRAKSAARIPLRRLGDPAELGRVAAFLLSPAASYVTGAAWPVDGGLLRGL